MNMDYSKAFELLNQDTEKERNKKAEKAVYDNLYNKGFRDGLAVLDKIRAEIENLDDADYDYEGYYKAVTDAKDVAIDTMRKYQKIAELYDLWRSGKCEYTISCMENIGKVLKDERYEE